MSLTSGEDRHGRLVLAVRQGDIGAVRAAMSEDVEMSWTAEQQFEALREGFRHGQEAALRYLKDRGFRIRDFNSMGQCLAAFALLRARQVQERLRLEQSAVLFGYSKEQFQREFDPGSMELVRLALLELGPPPLMEDLAVIISESFEILIAESSALFVDLRNLESLPGKISRSGGFNLATAAEIIFQVMLRVGLKLDPAANQGSPIIALCMSAFSDPRKDPSRDREMELIQKLFEGWEPMPWVTPALTRPEQIGQPVSG